jgi:phage-related tail protein
MVKKAIKGENKTNEKRQTDAIERIKAAMEHIKSTYSKLPEQVTEMKELLLQALKELFNVRASDQTLVKHKNLWHPKFKAEHSPELLEQKLLEETQQEQKPEEDLSECPTTSDETSKNESGAETPEPSPSKESQKFAPPKC